MKNKKWLIVTLLLVVFIINTVLVVFNKTTALDDAIHNLVITNTSEVLTRAMNMVTFLGSTIFIISIACIILIVFIIAKHKEMGIVSSIILIISTILNNVIKLIVQRPRPEYITVIEKSMSYPSGHSMASMSLYGFLIYLIIKSNFKKFDKVLFSSILTLIIVFIGISRIYLGAHFFTDVFGGYVLSLALLIIFDIFNDNKNWIKR